jgi:hypothetical protein
MSKVSIPYEFDPATVDTLLEGLDHLPHGRVRRLYDAMRNHALATMNPPAEDGQQDPKPQPRRLRKKVR